MHRARDRLYADLLTYVEELNHQIAIACSTNATLSIALGSSGFPIALQLAQADKFFLRNKPTAKDRLRALRRHVDAYLREGMERATSRENDAGSSTPHEKPPLRAYLRLSKLGIDAPVRADAPELCDAIDPFALIYRAATENSSSPSHAEHRVQQWIAREHELKQGLLFVPLSRLCAAWNVCFYRQKVVTVSATHVGSDHRSLEGELIDLFVDAMSEGTSYEDVQHEQAAAQAAWLLRSLRWFRVAQSAWLIAEPGRPQRVVRALRPLEFGTLRARLFGAQTGVEGLNQILRGGILPRFDRGRVWVVAGESGSGKTSLALQLACDMAARGRVACYLSLEEEPASILERIIALGLDQDGAFEVVGDHNMLPEWKRERSAKLRELESKDRDEYDRTTGKGLLVIVGPEEQDESAYYDFQTTLTNLSNELSELPAASWKALIIDSVEALQTGRVLRTSQIDAAQNVASREELQALILTIEDFNYWGILLSGADNPELPALSAVADAVVHLGVDHAGIGRWFKMLKCRTQAFDAGMHPMALRGGRGLRIYPNLQSTQRIVRHMRRGFPDPDFAIPLPDVLSGGLESSRAGIREGSSVLLWGAAQSGKSSLALTLLGTRAQNASGISAPLGDALLISFRTPEREYKLRLQNERAPAVLLRSLQLRWIAPGENLTGAHVAAKLESRLRRSRLRGRPIERIVFDGIETLPVNLPNVHADDGFWPTIIALLAAEGVTTFFLVNDEHRGSTFVSRHWFDVDYVFQFLHTVSGPGPETVPTFVIERDPSKLANVAPHRVAFDPRLLK